MAGAERGRGGTDERGGCESVREGGIFPFEFRSREAMART